MATMTYKTDETDYKTPSDYKYIYLPDHPDYAPTMGNPTTYNVEKYIQLYNTVQRDYPDSYLAAAIKDTRYALKWFLELEKKEAEKKESDDETN